MNATKRCLGLLIWLALTPVRAADPPDSPFYPFPVTVGGQAAVLEEEAQLFAVVPEPVKAGDELHIGESSALLIVNAFACKADGSVLQNGPPAAIIFAKETAVVKLGQTMDQKALAPGTYLLNIVAHNATSRVLLTVAEPGKKLVIPSLKSIVGFLKGES